MSIYKYKAFDAGNKAKEGLVEAISEEAAAEVLQEKGLSVLSISIESSGEKKKNLFVIDRVKPKDLVIFARQFSVLITASIPMVQALKVMVDQTENLKLKMVVSEVADEIDGGSNLSGALAKRGKIFNSFFVSVVKSGETSGKLDEVLNYLADEMEKEYDMVGKIKGAMIYPAFVFSGLVVVGIVMMVFVVPKLTAVILEMGGELPFATKVLIGVSDFMVNYWYIVIVSLVGTAVGVKIGAGTKTGKYLLDNTLIRLPIFGKLFQKIYLVRFTRSLNTLLTGGVTITKGLEITADVVGNEVYKEMIKDTLKEVEDGNSISTLFSKRKEIPHMVSQMLSIGEKTGRLDFILVKITDFYSREINTMIANLMTLMEPIIMVIMGIGVGLMVASIIMPMYNMASQV